MTRDEQIIERVVQDLAAGFRLTGTNPKEAETMALQLAQKVMTEAPTWKVAPFLEGRGDQILAREANEPTWHAWLEMLRAAGVTNDDIRCWWNMCAFEQEMLLKNDDIGRTTTYIGLKMKGLTPEECAIQVHKYHPSFTSPPGEPPDGPLPVELKRRVMIYTEKHYNDMAGFRTKVARESTFNAFVRKEIKAGNL